MGVIIYRIATAYTPRMIDDYKYGKCMQKDNDVYLGSGPVPFEKSDWSHLS